MEINTGGVILWSKTGGQIIVAIEDDSLLPLFEGLGFKELNRFENIRRLVLLTGTAVRANNQKGAGRNNAL